MEPDAAAVKKLNERFRREARDNIEKTIGRVVLSQIQIHGEVSYDAIRKDLHKEVQGAPSEHGQIMPELDTQLLDAQAALMLLLEFHEPHDDH